MRCLVREERAWSLRLTRVPTVAVEMLRLFVVVFCAGLGYEIAAWVGAARTTLTCSGPFDGPWLGGDPRRPASAMSSAASSPA